MGDFQPHLRVMLLPGGVPVLKEERVWCSRDYGKLDTLETCVMPEKEYQR